jgi:16S rRNA (uracil1498-N3)-methyltransferase
MPERLTTRVHLTEPLAAGARVVLTPGQAHHLGNVLRLDLGAPVAAFNARDGEWLGRIEEIGRNRMVLAIEHRLRPPEPESDVWLLFAPIKRARLDWLIEKATELGVTALLPVWTARTQAERLNLGRLRTHAIAAAEQSERLSVPQLQSPRPLGDVLRGWPSERRLLVCDETGAGTPISDVLAGPGPEAIALFTGPEGGFTQDEFDFLDEFPSVVRIGLGPRVLRADTAALAALAVVQALVGDWRVPRAR